MGGLHIAFKDALNNLHLKSNLRPLFQLIDPMHSKEWPHGFLAFLNSKAETKTDSASAKKFAASGGFAGANTQQLCFAEKVEERGALSRKVINNFLNPNWTADYGSGGNEEGHLLLMRSNYYKTEFILTCWRKIPKELFEHSMTCRFEGSRHFADIVMISSPSKYT